MRDSPGRRARRREGEAFGRWPKWIAIDVPYSAEGMKEAVKRDDDFLDQDGAPSFRDGGGGINTRKRAVSAGTDGRKES